MLLQTTQTLGETLSRKQQRQGAVADMAGRHGGPLGVLGTAGLMLTVWVESVLMTLLTWPGAWLVFGVCSRTGMNLVPPWVTYCCQCVLIELLCCSLNGKCHPSQAYMFGFLFHSWWHCFGRLWKLWDMGPTSSRRAYGLYLSLCSGLTCLLSGPEM